MIKKITAVLAAVLMFINTAALAAPGGDSPLETPSPTETTVSADASPTPQASPVTSPEPSACQGSVWSAVPLPALS